MYNVDEIVARLQNGDSLDAIGNELAALLNDAQAKHLAIQKAEEEKRAAEVRHAQRTATRRELLWDVLEAIQNYASYTDYAAVVDKWKAEVTNEDIAELDAQMIELLKTVEMLAQLNFDFNVKAVAPKRENIQKDAKKVVAVNPDKALGDFLKMMGW